MTPRQPPFPDSASRDLTRESYLAMKADIDRREEVLISEYDRLSGSILLASKAAFERWGIERTRLSDIAEAVGASRANLYNYFDGKVAIVRDLAKLRAAALNAYHVENIPLEGSATEIFIERVAGGIEFARHDEFQQSFLRDRETYRDAVRIDDLMTLQHSFWHQWYVYAIERGELADGMTMHDVLRCSLFTLLTILQNVDEFPADSDVRTHLRKFVVPALCPPDRYRSDATPPGASAKRRRAKPRATAT